MTERVENALRDFMESLRRGADDETDLTYDEQVEFYGRIGLAAVGMLDTLKANRPAADGMPPDTVMDRRVPEPEEREAIADMEAHAHAVLLATSWSSVAVLTGRRDDADKIEPNVIVQIEGRWNKSTDETTVTILLHPSLAETAIGGIGVALDRLNNPREGYHLP